MAGFISAYVRTNIREDRAELFGWMMADPAVVTRLAKDDPLLARKAIRLRAIVTQFDPGLGHLLPDVGG